MNCAAVRTRWSIQMTMMNGKTEETAKLYDSMPYETEFDAHVIQLQPVKGGLQVILDQTLFFPEEGGQSPDCGTLNGCPVTDVQIRDQIITHTVQCDSPQAAGLTAGARVHGIIDWDRRFSNMQNHTGEHILSGLIHRIYGFDNVGFHLSPQIVTMDMNGFLTEEQLDDIEQKANEAVWKNVSVRAEYLPEDELAQLDYRSKIDIKGKVRIVTIDGYDVCACCAPHVSHTGEIGLIKIIDSIRYKGGIRLSILCGRRALGHIRGQQKMVENVSHMLSSKQEEIPENVARILKETEAGKQRIAGLQNRLVEERISQMPEHAKNIWLFERDLDTKAQRELVNLLTERTDEFAGVFAGDDKQGYRFIIGSRNQDARTMAGLLKSSCQAKGGGKPEMVQGQVAASEKEISEVLPG